MKTRYGLEIRAATSADAPGLCDLLRVAGHEISPRAAAARLDAMRKEPGAALITSDWGPPIGLVLLHWYRTLEADQPTAQITTLLVVPTEWRKRRSRVRGQAATSPGKAKPTHNLHLADLESNAAKVPT